MGTLNFEANTYSARSFANQALELCELQIDGTISLSPSRSVLYRLKLLAFIDFVPPPLSVFRYTFTNGRHEFVGSRNTSPALIQHCHAKLIHEQPVFVEIKYSGDTIEILENPTETNIQRTLNQFSVGSEDEPVGEIEELLKSMT